MDRKKMSMHTTLSSLFSKKSILVCLGSVAILQFCLAVIGAFINYSPVPFWDMWDGYMNSYLLITQDGFKHFWDQHNEHRIVLSRLLFWIDLKLLNGSLSFLIVCNYLLAFVGFLLTYSLLKEMLKAQTDPFLKYALGLIMFCILFSWVQHENFTEPFQSQFFLAQIVPLGAFYALYKTQSLTTYNLWYFGLACFLGVTALGTMANGILTLPLMVLLSMLLKMNKKYSALLIVLSIVSLGFYFHGYASPIYHGSLKEALETEPLYMVAYIMITYSLVYLGSPFKVIIRSEFALCVIGLFFVLNVLYFFFDSLKKRESSRLQLTLITFLVYIGGSAVGTASGRFIFGLGSALASRYTTPVIMAWSVLLILYAPLFSKQLPTHPRRLIPILLIPLLLIPYQLKTFRSHASKLFDQKIAALALAMNVKDEKQITHIYPGAEHALDISQKAKKERLSIFNQAPYNEFVQGIGTHSNLTYPPVCMGSITETLAIEGEPHYVQIIGSIYNMQDNSTPLSITMMDQHHTVIGYALTGFIKGTKDKQSSFKGYILSHYVNQPIILQGQHPGCELPSIISPPHGKPAPG